MPPSPPEPQGTEMVPGEPPSYEPAPSGEVQPRSEQVEHPPSGQKNHHQQHLSLVWIEPQFISPHPVHCRAQAPVQHLHSPPEEDEKEK